jgi:tRNA(adenine34) deaminase
MSALFEIKVSQQVERLQKYSLGEIEAEVSRKRLDWLERKYQGIDDPGIHSPRQVYELLFFDYMGLDKKDLPVIEESPTEISWESGNLCSTLEACRMLGMDTRMVCRAAYEKSTQAFLSRLDPRLRFLRSYSEIRPYSPHCLERIVKVNFEAMMADAIEEALISRAEGNKGYGAVVAYGSQVLARAHDMAVTARDPSLHAEVNAIRQAVQACGDVNLSGCLLFSTCEPCPMCSSLAVWANLSGIVFGASIEETARLGKSRIRVSAQQIVEKSPVRMEVTGGVLHEECLQLYTR